MITLQKHKGVHVLRDDLLPGGTKSVLMPAIVGEAEEYVYASPVYGAFQIALAVYCAQHGKKATIFCAKRAEKHENTIITLNNGGNVIEVPHGYLSVVEKKAREYCDRTGAQKIVFGGKDEKFINIIAKRMRQVIKELGFEPDEVWCAVGSGALVEGILKGTKTAKVHGVAVGAGYTNNHKRLTLYKYPKPFDKPSNYQMQFRSMPNYDLKAWEFCMYHKGKGNVLFWNVY